MNLTLDAEDGALLLNSAREAIASSLEGRDPVYGSPSENVKVLCGTFVTLHRGKTLRGCIGTMRGVHPLIEAVREMARSSAFHDPRFPPLTGDELGDISIEISVLSPLVKISSLDEIHIGTHGLFLVKGLSSGVLLPQVAVEQGWNRGQFLKHTCRKAGLPEEAWKDSGVDVFIFSAILFSEDHQIGRRPTGHKHNG